jgi:hypothetical protein
MSDRTPTYCPLGTADNARSGPATSASTGGHSEDLREPMGFLVPR